MSDPARPKAPFLPPEIVTQIMDLTPQQSYPVVARISSNWTTEAQYRIFTDLTKLDEKKLRLLVPALESNTQLALLVESADICSRISKKEAQELHLEKAGLEDFTGSVEGRAEERSESLETPTENQVYTSLVFRLLSTVRNLKKLKFLASSDDFSIEQRVIFFSKELLPSLITLELFTRKDHCNRLLFECIVATAPNIESFDLRLSLYREGDFWSLLPGKPNFESTWKAFPKKLKHLSFSDSLAAGFSEGKIWKLEEGAFRGLCTLKRADHFFPHSAFGNATEFWEIIAPSIRSIIIGEISSDAMTGMEDMVKLETLHVTMNSFPPVQDFFVRLPKSIKIIHLSDTSYFGSIGQALEFYHLADNHHLNLTLFEIRACSDEVPDVFLDLSHIPRTITFIPCGIGCSIKESLSWLKIGEAKFEEIVLHEQDFEDEEVKEKCRELGIRFRLFDQW